MSMYFQFNSQVQLLDFLFTVIIIVKLVWFNIVPVELLGVSDLELGHHLQQELPQLRPLTDPVDKLLQLQLITKWQMTNILGVP